ncbi:MAG: hypothetical protein WAZ12_01125 [Candidatus Absconditicoccaceae bacterium]
MKKLIGFLSVLTLVVLSGCLIKNSPPIIGDIINSGNIISENPDAMNYSGELIVAGVGPDVSFESTVAVDTLVFKKTFEDHADHVFFPASIWNSLNIQADLIPGNHFQFTGKVKALDAAAGNRYYEVISVDSLTKISYPTQDEVTNILDRYNYCEKDSDCTSTYGKCPLPCQIVFNTQFSGVVEKVIDNFRNHQSNQCMYKCMEIKSVICNAQYKCEVK